MKHKGFGKASHEGINIMKLTVMFPDEISVTEWFEALVWPDDRHCPRCGHAETRIAFVTSGLPYQAV